MTDLVLHIGLPKTGTTTIQENYFSLLPNYLGRSKVLNRGVGNNWEVQELSRIIGLGDGSTHDKTGADWAQHIMRLKRSMSPEMSYILLSDEELARYSHRGKRNSLPIRRGLSLLGWSRGVSNLNDMPITRFLKDFSKNTWTHGRVKVVLTLRNQPDWLASCYSQLSDRIPNASQKDFEKQIFQLIKRRDSYIDWSKWISSLELAIGKENILVMLMEDLSEPWFFDVLSKFVGVTLGNEDLAVSTCHENKRSIQANRWRIRSLQPLVLMEIIKSSWPAGIGEAWRTDVLRLGRNAGKIVDPLYHRIAIRGRDEEIILTGEMKKRILTYVAPFNQNLSEYLGRDLSKLGY